MIKVLSVTVLMSVYNSEKFLREAIESVLRQTFKDFEFLIIDDASTDESLKIIKSYHDDRIKLVVHKKNKGLTVSLNEGLRLAKGEYIARMDADDVSYPYRLKTQISYLRDHSDVVVLGGGADIISEGDLGLRYQSAIEGDMLIKRYLFADSPFIHPSTIFKKKEILSIGGYDNRYVSSQDYDLWVRSQKLGIFANINTPLIKYRLTSTGISISKKKQQLVDSNKISDGLWKKTPNPMPTNKWSEVWPEKYKNNDEKVYYTILHMSFANKYLVVKNYYMFFRHSFAAVILSPMYILGRVTFVFKNKLRTIYAKR